VTKTDFADSRVIPQHVLEQHSLKSAIINNQHIDFLQLNLPASAKRPASLAADKQSSS
jgi:hypothetical protein